MGRLLAASLTTVASALLVLGLPCSPTAAAGPLPGPPFVERAQWWGEGSSLRVYPSPAGREAAGQFGATAQGDEAWAEVLALSPDADIPGMRQQFMCHWQFVELAQPGKISWNLEPWRPEVDEDAMIAAGCNPGGTEEAL